MALQSDRGVQENARAMEEALDALRTGSVAQAARELTPRVASSKVMRSGSSRSR